MVPDHSPLFYASNNDEWLAGPAPQVVTQMIIETT
ncbi:hypothetical protein DJ59_259 [Yersinia enterocolitica]|nr:hypothetical protein DJ59_259 [Yersinia enterocolitica]